MREKGNHYYSLHKEQFKIKAKEYYTSHKEEINKRARRWQTNNTSACKNNNREGKTREKHPRWNGGEHKNRGYVYVLSPQHPKCESGGYVKRCRLVLEAKLGRYLLPGCLPHHINGIKDDDSPENLMEVTKSEHASIHSAPKAFQLGKIQGIKEVVEWVNENTYIDEEIPQEWQSKLKSWGIE